MGFELVHRATVAELEGFRNAALAKYAEAFDMLQEARKLASQAAPSARDAGHFNDTARDALAPKWGGYRVDERRASFLDAMRRGVDCGVWAHLIATTDLEKLMDRKARDQFREQLAKDPPPATADNCFATIQTLLGDANMIFRRGVAEAFSALDRRFRSHDGFKIGTRIVLTAAITEHGWWNHWRHQDEALRDVERAFHVLDEEPVPDRMGGIVGAIDSARPGRGRNAYTAENDYFRVKVFRNGNLHVYFKRDDLVRKVNLLLADYYGEAIGAGTDVAEKTNGFKRTMAKNFGFFETPDAVGKRAITELGLGTDMTVLDPSAGRGALANKALAQGGRVTCVEVQPCHAEFLRAVGGYQEVICGDFFDQSPEGLGTFDRILMNPPFDGQRDIDHVTHAVRFLKPGGRLVAIMSAGTEFRENAKAVAFRRLVENMEGKFTDLPPGSFAESGTMVNSRPVPRF